MNFKMVILLVHPITVCCFQHDYVQAPKQPKRNRANKRLIHVNVKRDLVRVEVRGLIEGLISVPQLPPTTTWFDSDTLILNFLCSCQPFRSISEQKSTKLVAKWLRCQLLEAFDCLCSILNRLLIVAFFFPP